MVKVFANISKKVPLPGVEYSSQQFGAALEIEISDSDPPESIRKRLRDLYVLLSASVEEQIERAGGANSDLKHEHTNGCKECQELHRKTEYRPVTASAAQKRALYAIARSLEMDLGAFLAGYNCTNVNALSVQDASRLIDELRSRQNGSSDTEFPT